MWTFFGEDGQAYFFSLKSAAQGNFPNISCSRISFVTQINVTFLYI